jgi:hypothetical protein
MKGSDVDIMYVIPSVRVYEDINKVIWWHKNWYNDKDVSRDVM